MRLSLNENEFIADRYELIKQLGQGGMGTIYHAYDHIAQQEVALKRLDRIMKDDILDTALAQQSFRLALTQEFRILSSLRHPHIISVLDYGFDHQQRPFFTMTLLHNPRNILDVTKDAPLEEKAKIFINVLQALVYLHRRGIIHRDLKPDNIVLDEKDNVIVMDFGLAIESHHAQEHAGTLAYMAPEVLQGRKATAAADLYAIGVILYECLSGKHPFAAPNIPELMGGILTRRPDYTSIPDKLQRLIRLLLEKDHRVRYQEAGTVIQDLITALDLDIPIESSNVRESFLQTARFVGRESELALLEGALDGIFKEQPKGSLWLVGGESGIGKTRLMEELRVRSLVEGARVLRGQMTFSVGLRYHLWREIARSLVVAQKPTDFEASVLKEIIPDIGDLLNIGVKDAPELTGDSAHQRLVGVIATLIRRQTHPLVLILEDLQWTRRNLAPIQLLLKDIETLPLMIVGTYRNDESPKLPDELPHANQVELKRLTQADINDLVNSIIGRRDTHSEIAQMLFEQTNGNVFFLTEVIRLLAQSAGSLDKIGNVTLPPEILNARMEQVVEQHLKRMPDEHLPLLQKAALMGRELDVKVLEQLAPDRDLQDWLYDGVNSSILEIQDDHWYFAHETIRRIIVDGIREEDKKPYYSQTAHAVETVYLNNDEYADNLMELWFQAGDMEYMLHYTVLAVEHNLQRGNRLAAQKALERALHVVGTVDDSALWQSELMKLMGDVQVGLGNYHEAIKNYQKVLRFAKNPQAIIDAKNGLAEAAFAQNRYRDAVQFAESAFMVGQQIDYQRGSAMSLLLLGDTLQVWGRVEQAFLYLKQAVEIARSSEHRQILANCLRSYGKVHGQLGNWESNSKAVAESLAISREIGDQHGIAQSLFRMYRAHYSQSELSKAGDDLREIIVLAEDIGDKTLLAEAHRNLGNLSALFQRKYKIGLQAFRKALTLYMATGDKEGMVGTWLDMSTAAFSAGQIKAARLFAKRSLEALPESGSMRLRVQTQLILSMIACTEIDHNAVARYLPSALEEIRKAETTDLLVIGAMALAYRAWMHGHRSEGQQLLEYVYSNESFARTIQRGFLPTLKAKINKTAPLKPAPVTHGKPALDIMRHIEETLEQHWW